MELVVATDPGAVMWAYGRESSQVLVSVYAMRMAAVFTLSVSTVGLRTGALPRWVVYLGYVVALVLIVAAGEHRWTQLVFPTWVLLVSIVILVTRPPVPRTVWTTRGRIRLFPEFPERIVRHTRPMTAGSPVPASADETRASQARHRHAAPRRRRRTPIVIARGRAGPRGRGRGRRRRPRQPRPWRGLRLQRVLRRGRPPDQRRARTGRRARGLRRRLRHLGGGPHRGAVHEHAGDGSLAPGVRHGRRASPSTATRRTPPRPGCRTPPSGARSWPATPASPAVLPRTFPVVAASPVVFAAPRPMAEALGWPATQPSWAQLSALAANPAGLVGGQAPRVGAACASTGPTR